MSKFWDLLSELHKEELDKYGFDTFRNTIAPAYSASGIYDNENWIRSSYRKSVAQGVDFFYDDSLIGKPLFIEIDGHKITQDLIHSCWELNSLKEHIDFRQVFSVTEIGAGSGRTCEAIKRAFPHLDYTIVDIEPAIEVAATYLGQVGITSEFSKSVPPYQDLYIAISVFSELSKEEVERYMGIVKTGKYFYIKDWEHHINKHNETEVNELHYCIPSEFKCVFKREYPWYPGFFEALYKI